MKDFLKIGLTAVLLTAAIAASAQVPANAFQSVSLTNSFVNGTTTYSLGGTGVLAAPYIDCGKQRNVAFTSTIAGGTTGGVTNIYYFAPTVDGSHFDTNALDMLAVTNGSAGGGTNTVVKNLNADGLKGFAINSIVTAAGGGTNATAAITNISQGYGVKISAP